MERCITADRAAELLLERTGERRMEQVPLREALGRVLFGDLTAGRDVPPFDRSPLDGYAFRSEDSRTASAANPVTLSIVEELPAGSASTRRLQRGQAAKVSTGAPVPAGADCVIAYERTEFTAETVRLFAPCGPGNVVQRGEDVTAGSLLAADGTIITGGLLASLAGQGLDQVPVYRRPVISLINTGSELREPGQALESGTIYNTNRYMISSLLEELGAVPRDGGTLPDNPAAISAAIAAELEAADMVITTGGASVGDYDYAREAAELAGGELLFQKVQLKPGGAMLAAVKNGKVILSLSGNPGAAAVGLLRVAAPLIHRLGGRKELFFHKVRVRLAQPFLKESPTPRLLRGRLTLQDGEAFFTLNAGQENGSITSFRCFDLLAELPAGTPPLEAGTLVEAYRITE